MSFWKNSGESRQHTLQGTRKIHGWLWGVLAGLLFLVLGALQGQFSVIYKKAVMICLECIGIG